MSGVPNTETAQLHTGSESAELREGYNIQRRSVHGHKPWVVIFVFADGRAKIVASFDTKPSAQRYVRDQR